MSEIKTEFINETTELVTSGNKNLTFPKDNVNTALPKYWERNYIKSKINAIKNHEHKILLQFLWMTGVRISEAISIKKRDINFDNYTVMIKWQKSKIKNSRNIPLHPHLRDIMQLYTANMNLDDKIFPISRQRAWQLTQKYLCGHPHRLRHSFAVNWLKCDGRIEILSKMLGHSDIKTTMVYLDIVPIDQGKELIKIEF